MKKNGTKKADQVGQTKNMKRTTLIFLPDSRFQVSAKLLGMRVIDDRLGRRFYIHVRVEGLHYELKMPIWPQIKKWDEAIKASRDLLYMIDACLSYMKDGTINLPPHMEHLSEEVPRYVNYLHYALEHSEMDAVSRN